MQTNLRVNFILILFFIGIGVLGYKIFDLSVIKNSYYSELTANQTRIGLHFSPQRGEIFIKDLAKKDIVSAAMNKKFAYLEVFPDKVVNHDAVVNAIVPYLDSEPDKILQMLKDKESSVIRKRIFIEEAEDFISLNLEGIKIGYDLDRFYPLEDKAANLIGFWGFKNGQRAGQYGIEEYYDDVLSGSSGIKDGGFFGNFRIDEGSDIVLTIDKNIQFYVEDQLSKVMKKWSAIAGSLIVQDPQTGAILAMVSSPAFDSNDYSKFDFKNFINSNVQEVFEPGSSFKPITTAAALDLGKISPSTTYKDPGMIKIGSYTIRNFNEKSFGIQTMTQVLEKSLNTGAIFMERQIGDKDFRRYVELFGFGKKTDIDLFGEVSGEIKNLYSKIKVNFATASFGQGVAVTPIQLITAYSAIANGGKLMKPYAVDRILRLDGEDIVIEPEVAGRPIKETTSFQLKNMLVSVVDNGFDKARVKGYDIAGKTGTAQIPDSDGSYSPDEFIHNFVGFAPAYEPKFTVFIKIDRPKGIQFSSDSLSPVFGDIARFLLNYFGIPPTRQ